MPSASEQDLTHLRESLRTHDFLHRVLSRIEQLLIVVFHAEKLDRDFVRAAAEEILITDILTRHHGNIDGVYHALRKVERAGHAWEQAIADYAAYAHNYFTTPLGVVVRRSFFGDDCHFVTSAAGLHAARPPGSPNDTRRARPSPNRQA